MGSQAITDEDDEMRYCSKTSILFSQKLLASMRYGSFHPISPSLGNGRIHSVRKY